MADKDITEKMLEDYAEVFADIVNVLLFDGEQRVEPKDLVTSTPRSAYKASGKLLEQERDVAKYWIIGGVKIALFGVENQSAMEKYMPLRLMGYDGVSYRDEINQYEAVIKANSKERAKANDDGRKPTLTPLPPMYPVVTMVLYFGKGHWTAPRSVKECFDIPSGMEGYVSDYRINVFEIRHLTDRQVSMFKSDFRHVAELFTQMRKLEDGEIKEMSLPKDTFIHSAEVINLLETMTGDRRFSQAYQDGLKGGPVSMFELFDIVEGKGRAEGKTEGKVEGIPIGKRLLAVELYRDGDLTAETAARKLGMTVDNFLKNLDSFMEEAHKCKEEMLATAQ